ncbi:hypothetical protein LAG90_01005 [Marinilongibacter aquaticus]|uniref:hypothetical protein n=1 Tax=Marinilongibacter aquaticus TaxID=2975157 RepID=UPI0021BD00CD|nr:hypothetical protein [Marinilongibacter aquaticus]UBM59235.1 hypothetical protein LAG90_01005 [Marinilongibacter aquaticus]
MQKEENMMYPVFKEIELIPRSFFQKLIRQYPEDNCIYELNNLFATSNVSCINEQDIDSLCKKYKVNVLKDYCLNIQEFYTSILYYSLIELEQNENQNADLVHLKEIFKIDSETSRMLTEKVGVIILREFYEKAVSYGRISSEEREFLLKKRILLQLSSEIEESISLEVRKQYIENYSTKILESNRITPFEEDRLNSIARNLGVNIPQKLEVRIPILKGYWSLENLELEGIQTKLKIQKSEKCYLEVSNVLWLEEREQLKRVYGYAKLDQTDQVIESNLKFMDRGSLVVTNKRLLFFGLEKTSSIKLGDIYDIREYNKAVEVDKIIGRSRLFVAPKGTDLINILMKRLINEVHTRG